MNSTNVESTNILTKTTSSVSSPTPLSASPVSVLSSLIQNPKFTEGPLLSLSPKPMHEMTETELRAEVQHMQSMRQSHHTLRAKVSAEEKEVKQTKTKKEDDFLAGLVNEF